MNVILGISAFTGGMGGIERVGAAMANFLTQRGHKVLIVSHLPLLDDNHFPLERGVEMAYCPPGNRRSLRKILTEFDTDVAVTMSSSSVPMLWRKALLGTRIPWVYSEHTDPWALERDRWARQERLSVCREADSVHLLIEKFKTSLPLTLRRKVDVIPNFAVFERTNAITHKGEGRLLLGLGRLDGSSKRFDRLIRAFALLRDEFPEWRLEIWGDGPDRPHLGGIISDLGGVDRISLCGTTKEPWRQYSCADLLCMPSRFEGFPCVVAEAMAFGVPVVGFKGCPAVCSLIEENGIGVVAEHMTAESLAESLSRMMSDAEFREKCSANAIAASRKYSRGVVLPQWESLLLRVSRKKGKTALDSPSARLRRRATWFKNGTMARLHSLLGWKAGM